MTGLKKIQEQFKNNGYSLINNYKVPIGLLWQPDLIVSKNDFVYFILVKSNNSIPPSFLDRISKAPKENVIPLIIFAQKMSSKDEKTILSLGISLGYFIGGKLVDLHIKRKKPEAKVKKEIKKKLKSIDIFISSKQDIDEREFIKGRVHILRDTHNYPFFTHLIEYNKFNLNKLNKHIDEEMRKCEWIIILLEDNYSEVVSYEIKKSLILIDHENIFIFVKSTNNCKTLWKKELNKIKKLKSKSIKYFPYSTLNDLEVTLSRAINKQMIEICKKEKIEIYI